MNVSSLEKNKKDEKLNRQRYLIELKWAVEGRKPTKFRATVAVDRGTIQIHEMGIEDLKE